MKLTAESTVINDDKLNTDIDNAQSTANSAKSVADNTAQYFWFTSSGTDTGAHISEKTQTQFISSPSGGNLLARSNGIAIRDGMVELATFTATGMNINYGSTSVAFYGESARVGSASDNNVLIDTNGTHIRNGSTVKASFGTSATIGQSNSFHIDVTPTSRLNSNWSGVDFYNNTTAHGSIISYNYEGQAALGLYGPTTSYTDGGQLRLFSTSLSSYFTGGYFLTGGRLYSNYGYSNTISTDNRVAINSDGAMGRYASSSRRYKEQIEDSTFDPHGLYNLKARQFVYKDGYFSLDDNNPHAYDLQVGFIAEEVEEYYPEAAVYDTDTGEIESWEERKIIPPMLTLIQELNDRVSELERSAK